MSEQLKTIKVIQVDDQVEAGPGKNLLLHFSLATIEGDLIDSNFDKEPVACVFGDGNLLPGFEAVIQGMVAGAEKTVTVEPDQAFGLSNEENIHIYPNYQFPADMALEIGLLVSFKDSVGYDQPGLITEINKTNVTVDFNHPLAGRSVLFRVELLSVEDQV